MRVVVALGGNALGNTPLDQMELAKNTAVALVDLIEQDHELIITHGNGPQVGMINAAFEKASSMDGKIPSMPFSECGAMSQGYIGYHLQNAMTNECRRRNLKKSIATIVTQVEVDSKDPAFHDPTKPIGSFYNKEDAKQLELTQGYIMKEDAGRGYRRVIASPKPKYIVELDAIKTLIHEKHTVITVGGGGIPVVLQAGQYHGVAAVIDKDFASSRLAELIDADCFMILTAVDKVSIDFGKPTEQTIDEISPEELENLIQEGHFAPGSMLPKVQAAAAFAKSKPGRVAIIASLEQALDAFDGDAGTKIRLKS